MRSFFFSALIQGCNQQRDEELYQQAQQYWEKKMYGMAAENYERFFHAQPDHPKADLSLYKAGFIYAYYLLEHSRAIELFLRIPILYPDSTYRLKAHEHLAEIFTSHLKSYPQAIAQYDKLIELQKRTHKDLSGIYLEKARCYFLMEDWDNARKTNEKTLKEYPQGRYADKAAYQVGYIYFLEGRYEASERALRYFLETYPESEWTFDGMLHLARAKEEQHQTDESEELLRRLRKEYPDRAGEITNN